MPTCPYSWGRGLGRQNSMRKQGQEASFPNRKQKAGDVPAALQAQSVRDIKTSGLRSGNEESPCFPLTGFLEAPCPSQSWNTPRNLENPARLRDQFLPQFIRLMYRENGGRGASFIAVYSF